MPIAVPSEVELAWKAADVAQYLEAEPSDESRTVTMRNGSSQVIPAEMFGLAKFACDPTTVREVGEIAGGSYPNFGRVVDHWLLGGELPRWWREDTRMRAALRQNLGEKGILLYIHTLHEMRRISAMGHWASELWYAARFGVSERGGLPRTIISVWDNGKPYVSAEGIELFWLRDIQLRQRRARRPGQSPHIRRAPSPWLVPGSVVVPAVTRMFRGRVTVVSDGNRLDIAPGRVSQSEVAPTDGNLMVVDVPHVLPRVKGPRSQAPDQPERPPQDEYSDLGSPWSNQSKPELRREQTEFDPSQYGQYKL